MKKLGSFYLTLALVFSVLAVVADKENSEHSTITQNSNSVQINNLTNGSSTTITDSRTRGYLSLSMGIIAAACFVCSAMVYIKSDSKH